MVLSGNLNKMAVQLSDTVCYTIHLNHNSILLNEYLGKQIKIVYAGEINCIKCGRKTSKSFSQGYCYPCFTTAPETEECVLRPELCRAHEGIARDMEFAKSHCLIDHYVYLALTSAIKVGVTRNTQVPTRWIDQGATQAIFLAKTPNRNLAGQIEVALKDFLPDKTNWRNMLTGNITDNRSLEEVKTLVAEKLNSDFARYLSDDNTITKIRYPLLDTPQKVKSLNFDKDQVVEGILTGIKGQYLILDNTNVINIRKFGGYMVELDVF
ncbi:MAG: DUF2797 domain-containing protein [Bacteroidales bacterium]|nr:DUF2797 domain-containing protein [Bacteroidales bacterium]MBN2821380.1 DUF2797 domain-containing protein [Bacteroidales bacterium]